MTLDEAIRRCEEVAKENELIAFDLTTAFNMETIKSKECKKCANEHRQLAEWLKDYKRLKEQGACDDAISKQAAIERIPSVHQKHKWETCFECPLSHGCPKIKGCTNEQAVEYASKIPNDCPLSAQPERESCEDWYGIPSGEMTLEQARQAVRELRKYVMDNHILSKSEDAISRQYLIDKAVSWDKHYADSERYVSLLDIQNAPPVITPQPKMKIGKWIIMDIEDCELFMAKCSECGVIVDSRMISKYPYCHCCGAKMVEPKESEG